MARKAANQAKWQRRVRKSSKSQNSQKQRTPPELTPPNTLNASSPP
jgi:hypothetical protein